MVDKHHIIIVLDYIVKVNVKLVKLPHLRAAKRTPGGDVTTCASPKEEGRKIVRCTTLCWTRIGCSRFTFTDPRPLFSTFDTPNVLAAFDLSITSCVLLCRHSPTDAYTYLSRQAKPKPAQRDLNSSPATKDSIWTTYHLNSI